MNTNDTKFSMLEVDALKEILNVASGNAANALSTMANQDIRMEVPEFSIVKMKDIQEHGGDPERKTVGIYVELSDDIQAAVLFILEMDAARYLVDLMMPDDMADIKSNGDFNEIEQSLLLEVGNIIGASFVNALSGFTNMDITLSLSDLAIDMYAAIIVTPMINFGISGNDIIYLDTMLYDGGRDINGSLMMIPDVDSYDKFLDALGIKGM